MNNSANEQDNIFTSLSELSAVADVSVEYESRAGSKTFTPDFARDLIIDRTDIEKEFHRQPGLYAYYAFLYELAEDEHKRLERILEVLYAQLDSNIRNDPPGGVKLTEKVVENIIITNTEYGVAHKNYRAARKKARILYQALKAMEQRKDMIVQKGAISRRNTTELRSIEEMEYEAKEKSKIRKNGE